MIWFDLLCVSLKTVFEFVLDAQKVANESSKGTLLFLIISNAFFVFFIFLSV